MVLMDRLRDRIGDKRVLTTRLLVVVGWLEKRHVGWNMYTLIRRYVPGWEISDDGIDVFRPNRFAVVRYRYRGTKIPTPWENETTGPPAPAA